MWPELQVVIWGLSQFTKPFLVVVVAVVGKLDLVIPGEAVG